MLLYVATLAPEHVPIITTGGAIVVAVVAALSGIQVALINRGTKAARGAQTAAQEAAYFAQPTGNGYAASTRESLARIAAQLDHLTGEVGGMRSDHRTLTRRVDHHIARLDTHLEKEGTT